MPTPSANKPLSLGFKQIQDLLAEVHGVLPDHRKRMLFRFQHFRRLGFPDGVQTGRGVPARYGAAQIVALLLAFEMLEAGLTPERIVQVISETGDLLPTASSYGTLGFTTPEREGQYEDVLALIVPDDLAAMRREHGEPLEPASRVRFSPLTSIIDLLSEGKLARRSLIINMTRMFAEADAAIQRIVKVRPGEFDRALADWSSERRTG